MKPGSGADWVERSAALLGCRPEDLLSWRIIPGTGLSVIAPDGKKLFFTSTELDDRKKPHRNSTGN